MQNHKNQGCKVGISFADAFRMPGRRIYLSRIIAAIMVLFPVLLKGELPQVPDNSLPGSTWIVLENFSNSPGWKLNRPKFSDQSGNLDYSGLTEGPYAGSGDYLSLLFRGNRATPAILEPPEPIRLSGYAQSLAVFVYGWDQPVRMTLILRDRNGKQVRSGTTSLKFHGWKRLEIQLPPTVKRQPDGPFQTWYMELLGLEIRPIYNDTIPVRLSVDDLLLLTAPAIQLPEPMQKKETL
ncbi:MAG: hypothetical protein CMN77_18610 [Spirochaetaceae bacterium]|nr:hypothetical protein [Spirochaetaceae bacterium]